MDIDITFVKEQVGVQERLAAKYAAQPHRAGLHLSSAAKFAQLAESLESLATSDRNTGNRKLNVSLADLEGLPTEVMAELSISDTDRQEMIIEDIISQNAGVISLDKLIVRYYQRQGEVLKRNTLTSRLYRMAERGMIFNVPGKRGFYSTHELRDDEVRKIFGQPDQETLADDATQANRDDSELAATSHPVRARIRRRYAPLAEYYGPRVPSPDPEM